MRSLLLCVWSLLLFAQPVAAAAGSDSMLADKLRQYEGKIVVLNFWAAWCKPCKDELPLLNDLHRQFEGQGVQFVGANTDEAKSRAKADTLLKNLGVAYPIWFDLSDEDMKPLGLGTSIPATAIFDRQGTRTFRLIGEVKRKDIIERLQWLLGGRQGKPPKELLLPFGFPSSEYKAK
jgi:thiol-disulfide isomerase/thioredoxin